MGNESLNDPRGSRGPKDSKTSSKKLETEKRGRKAESFWWCNLSANTRPSVNTDKIEKSSKGARQAFVLPTRHDPGLSNRDYVPSRTPSNSHDKEVDTRRMQRYQPLPRLSSARLSARLSHFLSPQAGPKISAITVAACELRQHPMPLTRTLLAPVWKSSSPRP